MTRSGSSQTDWASGVDISVWDAERALERPRARRLTNATPNKVIGRFPSAKMGRVVWWESQIERDYIYLLEIDPDVVAYKEQPFRVKLELLGSPRSYVPDFLVVRKSRKQIVEVKPAEKLTSEENSLLFPVMRQIAAEHRYEYMVVTDRMIRVQPRLNNIKLLFRYARTEIQPQHQVGIIKFVQEHRAPSIGEASEFLKSKGISPRVLYSLLFWNVLKIDLDRPIGAGSCISLDLKEPIQARSRP
jgi:hypothetical protein